MTSNGGDSGPIENMLNTWATSFSGLALSIAAGVTYQQEAVAAQLRSMSIVTRVEKKAAWALVGANLAIAALGCVVFVIAVASLLFGRPRDVGAINELLTMTGLVEQILAADMDADRYGHLHSEGEFVNQDLSGRIDEVNTGVGFVKGEYGTWKMKKL